MPHVQYGNSTIEYDLRFGPRQTLAITVHPDLHVTVTAPAGTSLDEIEDRIKKRAPWILRTQRQYELYSPDLPPRLYISGETHRYLGRQYRLKVEEGHEEGVKLSRGYLFVTVRDKGDTQRVKRLLNDWYREQAEHVFQARLAACFPRMQRQGIAYPPIAIRAMKTRWGSCTPKGKILLNIKLVQVTEEFIDYVILHELCHLKEHSHSPRFYELLSRVLPDWRNKWQELNEFEFG
jgi:predicted metal-dependent hydrolase